jgi:hypothetical protein
MIQFNIIEIYLGTIESLEQDVSGRKRYSVNVNFWIRTVPILITFLFLFANIFITDTVISYLISFISIFAGLFFALIFIVADKFNNRRYSLKFQESNKADEENSLYIKRYRIFSKQFVVQISYMIIVSVVLVVLLIALSMVVAAAVEMQNNIKMVSIIDSLSGLFTKNQYEFESIFFIRIFINTTIYYLLFQYIILLFLIINNLYKMMTEDIKM